MDREKGRGAAAAAALRVKEDLCVTVAQTTAIYYTDRERAEQQNIGTVQLYCKYIMHTMYTLLVTEYRTKKKKAFYLYMKMFSLTFAGEEALHVYLGICTTA